MKGLIISMQKTTFKDKIGYGIASLGDAISYGLVGTFLLFFLTTVVKISPAIAGTIVGIGSMWDAIFNPIMGYFADKVRTRFGRRRPVIGVFSVFLGLTLFLLFTNIDMPSAVKPVYYGFMTVMFWSSFTGFFVPYYALGVDYASDYDERTSVRSFASFFNMIGALLCMAMPTMIVAFLESRGLSTSQAWSATGGLLGFLTFASIIATVIVSKNKDLPCEMEEKPPREKHIFINMAKEYISIAKLRPMKYLIVASLCSLIILTIIMSNMIYYLTYNRGLTSVEISAGLFLRSLLGMLLIPVMGKISAKLDKRITLACSYTFSIAGMIFTRLVYIDGLFGAFLYIFFVTFCTAIYWQLMPAIFYDVCEYDKSTTGKQREATILSFQGLIEAIAVGIGGQILGILLQFAGFNGEAAVQTENAMNWIEISATIVPVLFLLVAICALYKCPLKRNNTTAK